MSLILIDYFNYFNYRINYLQITIFPHILAANGERVGACPSPAEVTEAVYLPNVRLSRENDCKIDSECSGTSKKCCLDDSDIMRCVAPKPGMISFSFCYM